MKLIFLSPILSLQGSQMTIVWALVDFMQKLVLSWLFLLDEN